MPRVVTMSSSDEWLVTPSLLAVIARGPGMEREPEAEPALRRIVVGKARMELPHTVHVVVDRLGDGVREIIVHRREDDDSRAERRRTHALGAADGFGVGSARNRARAEAEFGEVLEQRR